MIHDQEIPWKRLAVEAAAIIASILLAFSIDAWWDDFQERKRSQILLIDLEAAFSENVTLLEENIVLVTRYQENLKLFIEVEPPDVKQIPPELTFETLESIWRPITTPNNNTLLVAKLDSGAANLSEYRGLQNAIAQWRGEVYELDERRVQLAAAESDALRVIGHHSEVRAAWTSMESGVPNLTGDMMRRAREDEQLMAIAARKVWQDRIHLMLLRRNREASAEVLDLIRTMLDR